MKKILFTVSLALLGLSCSKVADSDADEVGASSSVPLSEMSSISSVFSSSSGAVAVPTRQLNVIVDYLNTNAWMDTCRTPDYMSRVVDTVVFDKQAGDTLFFHGTSGRLSYYAFHCFLSKGECDGGPGIFMTHVQVEKAFAGGVPWSLAESDSAIIWNSPWGQPLDSEFTWTGPGYSAQELWSTGLLNHPHAGWICAIHPLPEGNYSFFNPETLTIPDTLDIVVDYKNHTKWSEWCNGRITTGIPETLTLAKTTEDSLWFARRGGNLTPGTEDTVVCTLEGKACIEESGSEETGFYRVGYQTSLIAEVPFNNPNKNSTLDSLAALDSLVIWQDEWPDSLEAFMGNGTWYTSFKGNASSRVIGGCTLRELE